MNHRLLMAFAIFSFPVLLFSEQAAEEPAAFNYLLQTPYCVTKQKSKAENTDSAQPAAPKNIFERMANYFAQNMREALKIDTENLHELSEEECFAFITRVLQKQYSQSNNIIDPHLFSDLDLVTGPNKDIFSVLCKLLQIHTKAGKITTFYKLANPTTDIHHLLGMQAIVEKFLQNQQCLDELSATLGELSKVESSISLACYKEPFNKGERDLIFSTFLFKFLDKFPAIKQPTLVVTTLLPALIFPTMFLSIFFGSVAVQRNLHLKDLGRCSKDSPTYKEIEKSAGWIHCFKENCNDFKQGAVTAFSALQQEDLKTKLVVGGYTGFFLLNQTITTINSYVLYSFYKNKSTFLQKYLIDLAAYFAHCDDLLRTLQNCNLDMVPEFALLQETLNDPTLSTLKGLLKSSTFTGEPSGFSNWARVFITAQEAYEKREKLQDLMAAVGKVDLYTGLAHLMSNHNTDAAKFCFASYVVEEEPVLEVVDSWNPLILTHKSPEEIIHNNFGVSAASHVKNVILTGPNTCGKTMITTGFVVAILLAQTLGIAPASHFTLTPFDRILVTLTIGSDGAVGDSRFKAEIREAKRLLETATYASFRKEKVLILLDEIFTGTNPLDGEIAADAFIKRLGKILGVTTILATHFFKLTTLAQEHPNLFTNYKVDAERAADSSIIRRYKIIPGVSHLNIAIDLLKAEGLIEA